MKCIIRMYLSVFISRSRNATNCCTELTLSNPQVSCGLMKLLVFRTSMSENSRIRHKSLCVFDDNTLTRLRKQLILDCYSLILKTLPPSAIRGRDPQRSCGRDEAKRKFEESKSGKRNGTMVVSLSNKTAIFLINDVVSQEWYLYLTHYS